MLQATYSSNNGTPMYFYVSTEDRRYNTDVDDATYLRYLFKFTNNMDGRVVYAYGQNQEVYERYTKVTFYHHSTEDVFLGRVNFEPNGYWNYKVYEVSSLTKGLALSCSTAPSSAQGASEAGKDTGHIGYYTISNPAGDVISTLRFTGENDTYDQELTELDAGTYVCRIYNGCDDLVLNSGFIVGTQQAQSDDARWLEITAVDQTTTGTTYSIVSRMPVGHSYAFLRSVGGATEEQITNITSKPQTTTHTFTQYDPFANNLLELDAYNQTGGSAGGGAVILDNPINLNPITQPSSIYGIIGNLAVSNVSTDAGGNVLSKGKVWYCVVNGTSASSTTQGYYTLQGVVEQGKLYVSEESGEEQVQYLENAKGVQKLTIVNGGSGYTSAPTITITGTNTSQVTATCTISGGVVNSVTLTSSGNGYTTDPVVELSGGGNPTNPATILASIEQTNYIYYGQ